MVSKIVKNNISLWYFKVIYFPNPQNKYASMGIIYFLTISTGSISWWNLKLIAIIRAHTWWLVFFLLLYQVALQKVWQFGLLFICDVCVVRVCELNIHTHSTWDWDLHTIQTVSNVMYVLWEFVTQTIHMKLERGFTSRSKLLYGMTGII